MARKKSKKIATNDPISVAYSGEVSVSVMSGKKTLSKKTYHNTGGNALFSFLANCVKDGGTKASSLLPNKIKLFCVDQSKKTTPSQIAVELAKAENYGDSVNLEDRDIDIAQASIFVAKSSDGNANGNSVTLSFKVPYAYITQQTVNMIGLYGRGVNATGYWSAYYLFKTEADAWSPISINSSRNYNLLIEWKMTFANGVN